MNKKLKILLLEDTPSDAVLVKRELQKANINFTAKIVDNRQDYLQALKTFKPALILSDFNLPEFDGLTALNIAKELSPETPFIIVTGSLSEEIAADCMRSGAWDYVVKERLFRLDSAVHNALKLKEERAIKAQAQRELVESEEKYRTLVESVEEGICYVDAEENFTFVNSAACKLFGYTKKELTGINLAKLLPPEEFQKIFDQTALRKQGKSNRYELTIIRKNGQRRIHVINASPVFSQDSNYEGAFVIFSDITEHKDLEQQLRHSQKMETIGTLAGGIAHDFNNILTSIMGFTEMALDDIPNSNTAYKNVENVLKGTKRARTLVQQILTFSRSDHQEKKVVDVNHIVKDVVALFEASLPCRITVNNNLVESSGAILANADQISQVVMNLCTNAYQSITEQSGTVEIGLEKIEFNADSPPTHPELDCKSYCRLTVADTGSGMDAATKDRIFEPFFTTKPVGEGSGMGLSIVHGIVKDHGGAITVDSELNKGSIFKVYLPCLNIKSEPLISEPQMMIRGNNEKILFVDDEPSITSMADRMFKKLGYDTMVMSKSKRALELIGREPEKFDLLITDMSMPQMTGVQLATKVFKINPDMRIILCTGYSEQINREEAKAMGIAEFVLKPFNMIAMSKTIRKVLDER